MARSIAILVAGVSLAVLAATSTQAADLIIDTPVEPGVVDVGGAWDGVYVGVFAGYGAGTFENTPPGGTEYDISGWLAGVALGANFTVADGIVAGVVGDIAWSNISNDPADFAGDEFNVDWVGSLRGRLGFDGGAFLPYLTAGLAVAGAEAVDVGIVTLTDTAVHIGWTVGAGVEFAVADNISVDLLYRYSDYGSANYNVGLGGSDVDFQTHQVSVGLNWRF
jgi:outer membrane immunogenic protein